MKDKHMGIGFATGRKNFKKVLLSHLRTWEASKKELQGKDHIRLHLFVSYDIEYRDTKSTDYTNLPQEVVDAFESITFVGEKNSLRSLERIRGSGKYTNEDLDALFGSGYAGKRNEILFAAIESKMDYLLFLDDDEYPMAVTKKNDVCLWSGQKVISSHLKEIPKADYTHGYHCGYISPIPQIQFNETLTETTFRLFIEAISNDIVNWEEIKRLVESGGVTYASTNILINQKILAVPQLNGCKFISGANLCINLTDPQKTFPFYNPPGARGEDTFLSTLLQERTVLKIPCYTFHDGFSSYQYLLEGSLPLQLKPITSEAAEINERFLNACIGWIRYKPLLVYIIDKDNYEQRMKAIRKALDATLPIISAFFTDDRFLDILTELDRYVSDTENHYRLFQTVQNTWARIVREIE